MKLFENALRSRSLCKRLFPVVVWTVENGAFRKRECHSVNLPPIGACARPCGDHPRAGILLVWFLSSKIECRISLSIIEFHYRILNVTAFSRGWGYFENVPHVERTRIKKMCFQKYLDTCGQADGASDKKTHVSLFFFKRFLYFILQKTLKVISSLDHPLW